MKLIKSEKWNGEKTVALLSMSFVFFSSLILFYRYIFVLKTSDFPAHIKHALSGEGYSLIQILFVLCYKATGTKVTIVFLMSLIMVATVLVTALFFKQILRSVGYATDLYQWIPVSASLLYISKLCIPEWSPFFYSKDSFITQPWHNSTYIVMRLFGMLTLMYYFLIQKDYLRKLRWKDCVIFSIALSLSNMSKPNMFLSFSPVMLIVLIYDFIRTKTKSFRNAFLFGLCVMLSVSVLLFQYKILYPSTGEGGSIVFSLKNGLDYILKDRKTILNLLLNYIFPIYVTFLFIINSEYFDAFSKRIMIQTWAMNILSVFTYLFVVETGPRAADGNFGWGPPFFAFLLFAVCFILLYEMKQKKLITTESSATARCLHYAHVVDGIFYFALLVIGYLSWGI